jgi:hypothetical protein
MFEECQGLAGRAVAVLATMTSALPFSELAGARGLLYRRQRGVVFLSVWT